MKCKENTSLEYMNINHEPVATRLMIDIKHQSGGYWFMIDIHIP